jgi:hypothetical protein
MGRDKPPERRLWSFYISDPVKGGCGSGGAGGFACQTPLDQGQSTRPINQPRRCRFDIADNPAVFFAVAHPVVIRFVLPERPSSTFE